MLNNLLLGQTAEEKLYVEDVFSTYLYSGTSASQTVTNGIDLAGKGGLVWIKNRTGGGNYHGLFDTDRGTGRYLQSQSTSASSYDPNELTAFNSNGFSLGSSPSIFLTNNSSMTYASWTFRKAPKFFDVVTWTANGSAQNINHNLGIQPGMIIVKATSGTSNWFVWHLGSGVATSRSGLSLNTTNASAYSFDVSSSITSTSFNTLYINDHAANTPTNNGVTYVAYLFAHDTTADGVIQCGSFTTDSSGNVGTINLGWEPQYILCKASSATQGWFVFDTMRGWTASGNTFGVQPNASSAELDYSGGTKYFIPTATGFTGTGNFFGTNTTVIYLAIRRGPMRVPTDATKVFAPVVYTGNSTGSTKQTLATGMSPDMVIVRPYRYDSGVNSNLYDRLRGNGGRLVTNTTGAQTTQSLWNSFTDNMQFVVGPDTEENYTGSPCFIEAFRRAPGFFDVVCYTGTGAARTVSHNLGVAPELMIVKCRSNAYYWPVYNATLGAGKYLYLNTTNGAQNGTWAWNSTSPTSSVFTVNADPYVNASGDTYVAYLFASCPGVSKVGSYTGNGSSQDINCGFTNGARFVLIKRTDAVSNWVVFDTARGITAGSDPFLSLNTTDSETGGVDAIDPLSSGFIVNQTTGSLNVSGGTYLYLAIA